MSMMWVGISTAVLGTGAQLYGANKQAKAVEAANKQNAELQAQQNQSAWNAYLMSRGVNPNGAATGSIPTNPQAINTKLPLWANVTRTNGASPRLAMSPPAAATTGGVGGRSWSGLGITPRNAAAPASTAGSIANSLLL